MKGELFNYLNSMKSSVVTKSTAGGGAGSIIKIELNKENSIYILYIECAWRIEKKDIVIATSADDTTAITGSIARSARILEGKIINSIDVTPFYDLCVNFTDGFCIRVFCVFSYDYEYDTNWQFWVPSENLSFEVTNHFKIKKGRYS